jgi:RNase P subunit RPR2
VEGIVAANRQRDNPASSSPQPEARACGRCGGLLVTEQYIDLRDDTGEIDFTALRCASCGEVVDPVILKNRQAPPPNLLYGTKARKFSQPVKERSGEKRNRSADGLDEGSQ